MRLLDPCIPAELNTQENPFPNERRARVPPIIAPQLHPPSIEIDLNTWEPHAPACNGHRSNTSYLAPSSSASFKNRRIFPSHESHTMSDDEDDDDRPPTAEEQRKWKKWKLDRERAQNISYLLSGFPESLTHDEWLRKERRERRAKCKNKAESTVGTMDLSKAGTEYSQPDDESSDGSTGTVKLSNATQQGMELMSAQPQQPLPTEANVNIHSPSKDKWFGVRAVIDSGTEENWISEQIADRCGLKIQGGTPISCLTFNEEPYETDRFARVTWRGEGAKKTQYTSFHIAKKAPFDILFGINLVNATPQLFRNIPTDPSLILVANKPNESEKRVIEERRVNHAVSTQAAAERARAKKQDGGGNGSVAVDNGSKTKSGGQAGRNKRR